MECFTTFAQHLWKSQFFCLVFVGLSVAFRTFAMPRRVCNSSVDLGLVWSLDLDFCGGVHFSPRLLLF